MGEEEGRHCVVMCATFQHGSHSRNMRPIRSKTILKTLYIWTLARREISEPLPSAFLCHVRSCVTPCRQTRSSGVYLGLAFFTRMMEGARDERNRDGEVCWCAKVDTRARFVISSLIKQTQLQLRIPRGFGGRRTSNNDRREREREWARRFHYAFIIKYSSVFRSDVRTSQQYWAYQPCALQIVW